MESRDGQVTVSDRLSSLLSWSWFPLRSGRKTGELYRKRPGVRCRGKTRMPLAGTLSIQPFEVSLPAVMGFESGAFSEWLVVLRSGRTRKHETCG